MSEELLPCPFCGRKSDYEALIWEPVWNPTMDGIGNLYRPSQCVCPGCGASVVGGETSQQAVDAWNTRAEPKLQPLIPSDDRHAVMFRSGKGCPRGE